VRVPALQRVPVPAPARVPVPALRYRVPMPTAAPDTRRESLGGLLRVAAAGVIWGTIPLVLRAADGASVVKVFYRVLFGGLALVVWMLLTRRLAEVTSLPRRKLLQLMSQGVLLCVNWVLFLTALDLTNVATAELLGYMGPVFVAGLAPFVTGERFDRRIVLPVAVALGGIAVILVPQGIALSNGRQLLGAVLAACSALTYAALLLRSKKILHGVSGSALMVVEYATASVVLLPFVIWLYATGQGPTSAQSYGALATLGIVHTALAGIIFLSGLRRVRTDHAAVLTYTEPASAVMFAAAFLGEALTIATVVGGAMVVAGGALVARLETAPSGQETPGVDASGEEDPDGLSPSSPD
jgi:drug/metabolite transporter (DMT)-like permease